MKRHSLITYAFLAVLALAFSSPILAGPVNKCVGEAGNVTYTDQACASFDAVDDTKAMTDNRLTTYRAAAPSKSLLEYGEAKAEAQAARVRAMNNRRAELADQRTRERIRERRHQELVRALNTPSRVYVRAGPKYVADYSTD